MSTISRSVALVGRPNVGKSRLFNRLASKRISIVHDQPGVTRDLITTTVSEDRGGFLLMDTGGIGLVPGASTAAIIKATEEQVDFALNAAGLVLFVVDAKTGLTHSDERIVQRLRAFHKPTLLVINKADDGRLETEALSEFARLGIKDMEAVSAEHGHGIEELLQKILRVIGPAPEKDPNAEALPERIKFCLIGRPNVGKSSIGNALLKDKRLIVSEVPGTTRDSIEINFEFDNDEGKKWPFTMLDTAGLRPRTAVKTPVEFFSQNRSHEAIAESDVVFLVIDALEGVTRQDKVLAGEAIDKGKGLAIVVNKWDLATKRFEKKPLEGYAHIGEFKKAFQRAVDGHMFFLPHSPVIFTSAVEGTSVTDILKVARSMVATMRKTLPTGAFNRLVHDFIEANPPKLVGLRRFKCYYGVQVARHPFQFRLYCNHADKLDDNYSRRLASVIQTAFKLNGCPIRFDLIGKPPRAEGTKFKTSKPGGGKAFYPKKKNHPRIAEG